MISRTLGKTATLKTIRAVASDFVSVDIDTIEPNMMLEDISGWTSFAHINIMLLLEEALGISFRTDDISSVETIEDLMEIISTATTQNL